MHTTATPLYRVATSNDIPGIQIVRHLVKENTLSNPALVTDADCSHYLNKRGRGWVCTINNRVVGFAIADLADHNIWALFIDPVYENQGIGKELHRLMLDWYFDQTTTTVWLGTAPGTRAEKFYTLQGWLNMGLQPNGELRFELPYAKWKAIHPE